MSRGINKVILIGSLGKDPEVRYMPNGGAVANVTLATSESWKDKNTGEQKEVTEWHRVVFFKRLAEIVGEYLKKGSKIYIEGKLQTKKWQDNEGKDRYTTEIVAHELQMLDSKGGQQSDAQSQRAGAYDQSSRSLQGQQNAPGTYPNQQGVPPQSAPQGGDFDDDIPFDRFDKGLFI